MYSECVESVKIFCRGVPSFLLSFRTDETPFDSRAISTKHDRLSNGESRVEREYSQKKKTKLKKILKKPSRLIEDEYLTDTRPSIAS